MDANQLVKVYIKIRDAKDAKTRQYETDIAALDQQLGMQWRSAPNGTAPRPLFLWDLDPVTLAGRPILTGDHCFGCTAGAGSSCGGALV